ncbi:hypothetical protein E2C01_079131 [Portunus trituberculatus]|uniref:Uncharacterized protein n=1 Tax=Portunus trituberculatus TaxID=210409 RepID=A0A5B7IPU0_PORTR|nr:hypothetical protein [Portunus trituberculatus]
MGKVTHLLTGQYTPIIVAWRGSTAASSLNTLQEGGRGSVRVPRRQLGGVVFAVQNGVKVAFVQHGVGLSVPWGAGLRGRARTCPVKRLGDGVVLGRRRGRDQGGG